MGPDEKLANAYRMLNLARMSRGMWPWAEELTVMLEEEVNAFEAGDEEIGHFINREVIAFCTDRMKVLGKKADGLRRQQAEELDRLLWEDS